MSHTSFIYLNCKRFDGTVFVTQIADWIRLFQENGINFQYYHQFYGTEILHRKWCKDHLEKIKTVIPVIANVSFSLPEKYFFSKINAYILNYILNKRCKDSSRIVIFSRMLYGKEIAVLKKISRKEIIYIYDARGATMEEHKYQLMKDGFHLSEITPLLQHIADVEMATVQNSDLIFLVTIVNLPALRNCQRCMELFDKLGIEPDKVQILINRYMENDEISADDVEEVLGKNIYWKIPNNYFTMMSAINKGVPVSYVNPDSNGALSYKNLALMVSDSIYRQNLTKKLGKV